MDHALPRSQPKHLTVTRDAVPNSGKVFGERFQLAADQVMLERIHRRHAHFVTTPVGKCQTITDSPRGLRGYGLAFTNGRGNEVCVAAVNALKHHLIGRELESLTEDFAAVWNGIAGDSQVRWLGPEKGVIHLATAALVNAVWDLYARAEEKPLWKLLVDMTPEQLVACVPFRHITDALTREEALAILQRNQATKSARQQEMLSTGYPAYTTSAGWLGYSDEKVRKLVREGLAQGWTHFKMKVGHDLVDDVRRSQLIRQEIGAGRKLMMDANQVWDVDQAIDWMHELKSFDP